MKTKKVGKHLPTFREIAFFEFIHFIFLKIKTTSTHVSRRSFTKGGIPFRPLLQEVTDNVRRSQISLVIIINAYDPIFFLSRK
jgi:hypothetical protein